MKIHLYHAPLIILWFGILCAVIFAPQTLATPASAGLLALAAGTFAAFKEKGACAWAVLTYLGGLTLAIVFNFTVVAFFGASNAVSAAAWVLGFVVASGYSFYQLLERPMK